MKVDGTIQKTGYNGSPPYATVEYTFDPLFVLPAASSTGNPNGQHTTQRVPHILLPRGLLPSLDILGKNTDIYLLIVARVGGDGGESFLPFQNRALLVN